MTLEELLQKLSYGTLAELAIGGEGSGLVPEEHVPKVVLWTNAALTALYTRFPLQLRTLVIDTVDDLYEYHLRPEFAAQSGSLEPNKYIIDTAGNPFRDDVLQVIGVFNYQHEELPLNDRTNELSWFTMSPNTLSMAYPQNGSRFFVQYKAQHPEIPLFVEDPAQIQVVVPKVLELALMSHIASDIYATMSMESALRKSGNHMTRFEAECLKLEEKNILHSSTDSTNIKPKLGGWV